MEQLIALMLMSFLTLGLVGCAGTPVDPEAQFKDRIQALEETNLILARKLDQLSKPEIRIVKEISCPAADEPSIEQMRAELKESMPQDPHE